LPAPLPKFEIFVYSPRLETCTCGVRPGRREGWLADRWRDSDQSAGAGQGPKG